MFTPAAKGSYPKYPAPPRPSLLAKAIQSWRIRLITDEELERAFERGLVENLVEMVAAGMECGWDGQLRWDSPVYLLGGLKGFDPIPNRMTGEQSQGAELTNGDSIDAVDHSSGNGHQNTSFSGSMPRAVEPIAWKRPLLVNDYRFLAERAPITLRPVLTGPVTLSQLCDPGIYEEDIGRLTFDIATALNREIEGLAAAGATEVLIEEPLAGLAEWTSGLLQAASEKLTAGREMRIFLDAPAEVFREKGAIESLPFGGFCFTPVTIPNEEILYISEQFNKKEGVFIELGVVDARRSRIEHPEEVAESLVLWGERFPPERIYASTTSGLGSLTRELAFLKLEAVAKGAELARREMARRE